MPQKTDLLTPDRAQLLATNVETQVLTAEERERYEELITPDSVKTLVARTVMKSPLLVIFPLAGYVKSNRGDEFPCNDDIECHIGFSISFPNELPNGMDPPHRLHQYALSRTAVAQGRDHDEDEQWVYDNNEAYE